MAFDFRALKAEKKPHFHENYRRYYPVESLEGVGFRRSVCTSCGRGFWSNANRDVCDEPLCSGGYRFIGKSVTKKKFGYKEAWDEYVKTFSKWGYVPIKRYPVVCRWYEDLYFVGAGINDFQPYVVSGEVAPPAPAVLEPQFCMRFSDIDSVGITGRHYSGFIMVGQHTFNTEKQHVYFKDEGILQMHEFLTQGLGISDTEIVYHEDVWAGGGNYGPSMEFFSHGLELGNQVYMQYEVLPDGTSRELKTKVIDMGAGLERWSWFSQGTPMSYDSTFPKVMDYLYKKSGVKFNQEFMCKFGKYAGLLDIDDVDDIGSVWGKISGELGIEINELKKKVYMMRSLYAMADHSRTLLVAIHDGALPSNVGGGYNLRNILRRIWSQNEEYGFGIEVEKLLEEHIKEFGQWYTELQDVGSLYDIIACEHERYVQNQLKGRKILEKETDMNVERMVELYDSHGVSPDIISKLTKVEVPDDFFRLVEIRQEEKREQSGKKEKSFLPDGAVDTEILYTQKVCLTDGFEAVIQLIEGNKVILDKTYFYPEGGGQEEDHGVISGATVTYVEKILNTVVHHVEDASKLNVGDKVKCVVDCKRREQLTRHHSATHLVNAAAREVLGSHIWQAGAHKSDKIARLDITHYKSIDYDTLKKIEKKANEFVAMKKPVVITVKKRNDAEREHGMILYQGGAVPGTEIRVVDMIGVDVEACAGTHVNNTGDIGTIRIISAKRIQDGVVRLEFTAGDASQIQDEKEDQLHSDSLDILAKAGDDFKKYIKSFKGEVNVEDELESAQHILNLQNKMQIPKTIEKFVKESSEFTKYSFVDGSDLLPTLAKNIFEKWKNQNKAAKKTGGRQVERLMEEIKRRFSEDSFVKVTSNNLNIKTLTETAKKSVAEGKRAIVILNFTQDKVNIICASSGIWDAKEICATLCAKLGGGGGGKSDFALGGGNSKGAKEVLDEFQP